MEKLVKRLNRNTVFKFLSSVRLAVPLLLVIAGVVAYGTVLESRYGAQYAKLAVYHARWFDWIMVLLWINIFCATVSRYPFKKHHTGFVITHLGLLLLLGGGTVTSQFGIDGQLRVVEGMESNEIVLPGLVVETANQRVDIARSLSPLSLSEINSLNASLAGTATVLDYLPFAKVEDRYIETSEGTGVAVGFFMRSPFFSVGEWLHETEQPELAMGPAKIRLLKGAAVSRVAGAASKAKLRKEAPAALATKAREVSSVRSLQVLDEKSGSVLKTIPISDVKRGPIIVQGVRVAVKGVFERATVVNNKLADAGGMPNPALELSLERGGETLREVAFARFADFSLNPKGSFGLRFKYQTGDAPVEVDEAPSPTMHIEAQGPSGDRSGNVIEFLIDERDLSRVRVDLYKNNHNVLSTTVAPGETIETPWMGMKLSVGAILARSVRQTVASAAPLVEKAPLPGAAIRAVPAGFPVSAAFWLQEGQERVFEVDGQQRRLYFGPEIGRLPFSIRLTKFAKTDYPGSSMAMSFESTVQVAGDSIEQKISMNEPLKRDGFTLYQSSYEMEPGRAPASIFSVNKDPGRPIKYLGSIIIAIGIIVYTLMKSRAYRKS